MLAEPTGRNGGTRETAGGAALLRRLAVLILGAAVALVVTEYSTRFVFARTNTSSTPAPSGPRSTPPRVSKNSLGFREREIGPKGPDQFRIAVIGDSYTWGQALEERERYSNLLGEFLGPHYDVLNFGVPSRRMPDYLNELETVLRYSPDFVLLQMNVNNFETANMHRPAPLPLIPHQERLVEWSVVGRMLSDRWAEFQEALGLVESYNGYLVRHLHDPDSPDARESFTQLRRFFDRARAAGVPSGAVLFPAADAMGPFGSHYPFGFMHDRVNAVCAEARVPCLDLLPLFARLPDPSVTWVSRFDAHYNAPTNRRVALEMLAAFGPAWRR